MASPNKPLKPAHGISPQGLDAIKGLLIAFVVFGHMKVLQTDFFGLYSLIYIFHVAGFLILPFLLPSPVLSKDFIFKRLTRYGVPFIWFFSLATVLYSVVYQLPSGTSLAQIASAYALGLVVASADTLEAASGFKMFWFLPALLSLTLFRAAYATATPKIRIVLFSLCVLALFFAGSAGPARLFIPWGLVIAMIIFPVGMATAALFKTAATTNTRLFTTLMVILSAELLYLCYIRTAYINVGDVVFYSLVHKPLDFFLTTATMVVTVATIFLLHGVLKKIPLLPLLGSLSLPVYLLHPFINQLLQKVLAPSVANLWLAFPVIILAALAGAVFIFRIKPLRRILFPASHTEAARTLKNPFDFTGI